MIEKFETCRSCKTLFLLIWTLMLVAENGSKKENIKKNLIKPIVMDNLIENVCLKQFYLLNIYCHYQ